MSRQAGSPRTKRPSKSVHWFRQAQTRTCLSLTTSQQKGGSAMTPIRTTATATIIALAGLGLAACATSAGSTSGSTPMAKISLPSTAYPEAHKTMSRMVAKDSGMRQFIKNAYGYAVFPTVAEGALIVGGAHGSGR